MIQRHSLTDDQWELVADLVEVEPKPTGRPPKDRRTILNGIFWIRTGAAWRYLLDRLYLQLASSADRKRLADPFSTAMGRWRRPIYEFSVLDRST